MAKRESQIGIDIYYIGSVKYKLEYGTNSVKPLYLSVKSLLGRVEKIDGSSDSYLIIDKSNREVINVFNTIREYIEGKAILDKIDGFDKIRFKKMINMIEKFSWTNVCTTRSDPLKRMCRALQQSRVL